MSRDVKLNGLEVVKRMRAMPSTSFTALKSAARSVGGSRSRPYISTVWPRSVTSRHPSATSRSISSSTEAGVWLRCRPRVTGTTQNVQCFSQPSITVTKDFKRAAPSGRAVIFTSGASPVSSTGRSRRARATSSPTRAIAGEPNTRSTPGARLRISFLWSCAMQPITPTITWGRARFSARSSPSFENTLSSAFSRIAQVLRRMRSASCSLSVSS